jgi:hypothetical protein
MNNRSSWPPTVKDKLSCRYFMDLSEVFEAGYDGKDVKLELGTNEGAKLSGLKQYKDNIYYFTVDFTGTQIMPCEWSKCEKDANVMITYPNSVGSNQNDWSYKNLTDSPDYSAVSFAGMTPYIPLYDDGKLLWGQEPGGEMVVTPTVTPTTVPDITPTVTPTKVPGTTPTATPIMKPSITPGVTKAKPVVAVTTKNNGNSVSQTYTVTAQGGTIDLLKLSIVYTADGMSLAKHNVWFDTAALQLSTTPWYMSLTDAVIGTISSKKLTLTVTQSAKLAQGSDRFIIDLRFAKEDWTVYDALSNPTVSVYYDGKLVE